MEFKVAAKVYFTLIASFWLERQQYWVHLYLVEVTPIEHVIVHSD
jgi:hypothetical protein